MDRGPAALFGAIVAVGLGPAMWLGVRLGAVDTTPARPPVVGEHTAGPEQLVGGSGAGDSPLGGDQTVKATPRATVLRLTESPSPRAHTRKASPTPTQITSTPTVSASPSGTGGPSTPPTESTGGPSTPPTESTTQPTPPPPSPPTTTAPGTGSSTGTTSGDSGYTGGIAAGGPA
ncbi:hypothetical protein [Actinoplanes subtropicus]|uniref:hypothetical protein n=1 Tax=Actinoplanes subtropicus TaxID=543632 RepID=UPI0004C3F57C|nr:hypothetical protein [Actinoplanes subtropicus]